MAIKRTHRHCNSLSPYLVFVNFFTRAKFLENKIYTEKMRKLRQNTQKIVNFLRYYGKIHSKLPIFRIKSVKIYTSQKKFTRIYLWDPWQIWGMGQSGCWSSSTIPREAKLSLFNLLISFKKLGGRRICKNILLRIKTNPNKRESQREQKFPLL